MDASLPCRLSGISRRFGQTRALDDVDFRMQRGEVVSLLGPNGSGKTTLVRVLLGLIRATAGSVVLWGLPLASTPARRRVGVMLQVGRLSLLRSREGHAIRIRRAT